MTLLKDLLHLTEVAAPEVFMINGHQFKAQVHENNKPSDQEPGSWDLVLFNKQNDITVTVSNFFKYTANGDKWQLTAEGSKTKSDDRPSQFKPFPGGIFEKQAIDNFCAKLTAKDVLALKISSIDDPEEKFKSE